MLEISLTHTSVTVTDVSKVGSTTGLLVTVHPFSTGRELRNTHWQGLPIHDCVNYNRLSTIDRKPGHCRAKPGPRRASGLRLAKKIVGKLWH